MKKNALGLILFLLGATLGCIARASTTWSTQDYALFTGDFSGDGRDDVLYVSKDGTKPSGIVLTDGSGQPTIAFQSWPSNYLGLLWSTSQFNVIVADFNHDGHADILLQSKTPGDSYLLLANSQGLITGISQTIAENTAGVAWSADQHHIIVGDFNGDGRPDVFLQATTQGGLNAVILASASGTFTAGSPAESWNDGYLGFNWATSEANVYAGDFNGDGYADLLIQAKPKWVMINYTIPFPVPTYPPNMNGVVLAAIGGLFQATGVQEWSRNAFGVDWSPLSTNIVVGRFDTAFCATCSDVILQGTGSGKPSYLVLGNTSGAIFSTGTALASNATWTADAYTLVAGNFSGASYSTGVYFQSTNPAGTNYVADDVSGSVVTLTTSDTTQETAQAPTSAGRSAGQFAVTATGGASYNIPLWNPAGARNIEPHLALDYLSGGPDGPMGPGWSLTGISAVTRCNRTWAQNGAPGAVTLSSTDALCLDGVQLVPVSGYTPYCPGGSPYGSPATYETALSDFNLISSCGTAGNGPAYFEVQGKDGRYYEYGNGGNSEVYASGSTTPFAWGLDKVSDRQGNNMVVTYVNGSTVVAPSTIQYTQTPSTGSGYPYEVDFSYSGRPGGTSISKYVAGAPVIEGNVLTLVNVISQGTSVRQYHLIYSSSPTTGRPLLSFVQECGGSSGTDCLRPTSITYQSGSTGWSNAPISTGINAQYGYLPVDLNGDGIPDALYAKLDSNGSSLDWYFRMATTSGFGTEYYTGAVTNPADTIIPGKFSGTSQTQFLAKVNGVWTIYTLNASQVSFGAQPLTGLTDEEDYATDWDGDGLPDLVGVGTSGVYVRRNTTVPGGAVTFAAPVTVYSGSGTLAGGINPNNMVIADFNGDGRGDFVVDQVTTCNTGKGFCRTSPTVLLSNGFSQPATAINLGQGDITGIPGDWNGDGCTDIIGSSYIWISNCAGGFTTIASAVPNTANGPTPILAVDWDGDGQTDRLYADPTTNTWMVQSSTGNGISAPVSTGISVTAQQSFFVVDQNSDGQPDLGYIDSTNAYNVSYYPHQGFETPPDIANSFSDGFGISFSPSYAPISRESYAKGTSATFPDEDFQGPMYVVDRYSASDGIGGTYQQTFAYSGARLNLQGRGFEGFAITQVQDSRNGVIATTSYRQDYPYVGMVAEHDLNQNVMTLTLGGVPVSPGASSLMGRTVNKYAAVLVQGGACASGVCFPYVQERDNYNYEVDGPLAGGQISTSSTTYAYDNFGNVTSMTSVLTDTDNGGNGVAASPYYGEQWTTTIQNKITNNTSTWCLGLPYDTTTTNVNPSGQATRTVDHTIDYQNCRATQEVVQPGDPKLQMTTNFGFDGCGNTDSVSVVGLDQNGAPMPARTTGYNYGTMCIFPERVTDALQNTTTIAYNYGFGVESSVQDPNGLITSWPQYDDFGRPQVEVFGDGTQAKWSYSDCVASDCWGTGDLRFMVTETLLDSNGNQIRTDDKYFDGLGRPRLTSTNRALGVWTTSEVDYDSLGRKTRAYLPYSSSSNGYNGFVYDVANRVLSETLYDSNGNAYSTTAASYFGLTMQVKDALGNVTQLVRDVSGALREVIDPAADGNSTGGVTQYVYDPFGNLTTVTDADHVTSTYTYNIRGFKTASNDANSGVWVFTPDSLNELVSQTDAKSQTTTFQYDLLGRLVDRYEPESTMPTIWNYGTSAAAHNIGKLASVTDPTRYSESYTYDNLAREQTVVYTEDGTNYQYDYTYNNIGKLATITYPTSTSGYRFELRYAYDNWGYLNEVEDANAGTVFWQLEGENDSALPTAELLGNGVQIHSSYMPWSNEILARSEGSGASTNNLGNLSYTWDLDGNLHERQDLNQNLTEIFTMDSLNRLTSTTLNGTQTLSVNYTAAGDIIAKSDVGSYAYADPQHPHAVTTAGSWTMAYDGDGNMTSRDGEAISWYSYNQPNSISFGGNSTQFFYDSQHERYKQVANYGGTVETTYYVGQLLQVMTRNGVTEYRHLIPAGSATVIYTRRSDGSNDTYYSTSDHQSSTDLVIDSGGNVLSTESFAPFGARRGSNWQGVPSTSDYSTFAATTRQGFTGQEMLDSVSLVDMNGRVEDPYLGRFLSTDPVMQDLATSQAIDPYSYTINNPVSLVDPSGFSWLSSLLNPFSSSNPLNPFSKNSPLNPFSALGKALNPLWPVPGGYYALAFGYNEGNDTLLDNRWLQPIAEMAACYWGGPYGCAAADAYMTRLDGGSIDQSVEAGVLVLASDRADTLIEGGQLGWAGTAVTKGIVGGAVDSAEGGSFWQGFEIAAGTSLAQSTYVYYTHHVAWWPGGEVMGRGIPCGQVGSNCYVANPDGSVPSSYWHIDTFGLNLMLPLSGGCFVQSGACSAFLDQVPGLQAVSQLHDAWMNILTWGWNVPAMLPAAGISYGALFDSPYTVSAVRLGW